MSEIEKMYENAGINKIGIKRCSGIKQSVCLHNCNECESFDYKYPPFTAEKQIEIIKFLIGKHASFNMFKNYEQKDLYMVYYECRYFPKQYLPFEEALAESINYLWQSLTSEEKLQVKGILE